MYFVVNIAAQLKLTRKWNHNFQEAVKCSWKMACLLKSIFSWGHTGDFALSSEVKVLFRIGTKPSCHDEGEIEGHEAYKQINYPLNHLKPL